MDNDNLNQAWKEIKYVIDELGENFFPSSSGNISVKLDDVIYCTPSGYRKKDLVKNLISVVNMNNDLLSGPRQTSEIRLHLEIYKNFGQARYVIHTHPLFCSIFACTNRKIDISILPEYYIKIKRIVYVKYVTPGTVELAKEVVRSINRILTDTWEGVVILRNHGLVVFSNDLNRCIDLTKCTEEIAKINYLLLGLGKYRRIPKHLLNILDKYSR
ncbi:MAG: class II aldolase/adducin family protein [Candidatus Calescibacterium sp.]|nr:class II aldolase/adducin family protein [Candidatus Calescibacterium sp.]MCX7972457.1 class II aldolase/adducin family protein [bacterium]MDW8195651.1 class II aldolase/adducin family protein [Candidatus Calescibacterium sp.]